MAKKVAKKAVKKAPKRAVKSWYLTKKPNEKIFALYDFARSAVQAKQMLKDLKSGSPVAHKSTSEGGLYNIYVRKGSVYWR